MQALANLVARSSDHCHAAWTTRLPAILRGLQEGALPNDAADNSPYGSPDAVELVRLLAAALLRDTTAAASYTAAAATEERSAMQMLAQGPAANGCCPGWSLLRSGPRAGAEGGSAAAAAAQSATKSAG